MVALRGGGGTKAIITPKKKRGDAQRGGEMGDDQRIGYSGGGLDDNKQRSMENRRENVLEVLKEDVSVCKAQHSSIASADPCTLDICVLARTHQDTQRAMRDELRLGDYEEPEKRLSDYEESEKRLGDYEWKASFTETSNLIKLVPETVHKGEKKNNAADYKKSGRDT